MAKVRAKRGQQSSRKTSVNEAVRPPKERWAIELAERSARANSEDEEDLLMRLALAALKCKGLPDDAKARRAYMWRAEQNERISEFRRNARKPPTVPLDCVPNHAALADRNSMGDPTKGEEHPKLRALAEAACSELHKEKEPDRTILRESLLEGRRYSDIAARLPGCPTADAVRQCAHRARLRLRRRLRKRCRDVLEYFGLLSD